MSSHCAFTFYKSVPAVRRYSIFNTNSSRIHIQLARKYANVTGEYLSNYVKYYLHVLLCLLWHTAPVHRPAAYTFCRPSSVSKPSSLIIHIWSTRTMMIQSCEGRYISWCGDRGCENWKLLFSITFAPPPSLRSPSAMQSKLHFSMTSKLDESSWKISNDFIQVGSISKAH